MGKVNRFARQLIGFPVKLYQYLIRPLLPPSCRFYPSCSEYALNAFEHHGVFKGLKLTCCRLLRCHPWCEGGYDPVLPNKENP